MISRKVLSGSAEETEKAGYDLMQEIVSLGNKGAFIALYGELGAGKTVFVRGMAKALCPDAYVCSPTFAIMNEYGEGKSKMCHFDMYRIKNDDDLYSTGFYDIDDCFVFVEWSENIEYALPKHYFKVAIEYSSADTRSIKIDEIGV